MGKAGNGFHLARKTGMVMLPLWIGTIFQALGWVFLLFKPLGFTSWSAYAVGVAFAVATGLWTRRAYRVTVLDRSESGVAYWVQKRKAPAAAGPTVSEIDSRTET